MKSSNPMTRKRQRRNRKERMKAEKQKAKLQSEDMLSLMYSPYQEDLFMLRSCASKNRYDTEEKAIHACIVGSARTGASLVWYGCSRCEGWHITSRPMRSGGYDGGSC